MKTIMAMYVGNEPLIARDNGPFYFGELEIVKPAVRVIDHEIEFSREPQIENCILVTGAFFIDSRFNVGILPGTSFVLNALSDSVAEPLLAGVDNFMVKEIEYETFLRVLSAASKEADNKACQLGSFLELAYFRYFGIDPAELKESDQLEFSAMSVPVNLVDAENRTEVLEIHRVLRAKDNVEAILSVAAMLQDISNDLALSRITIVITLLTTDVEGRATPKEIYRHERDEKTSNESSN